MRAILTSPNVGLTRVESSQCVFALRANSDKSDEKIQRQNLTLIKIRNLTIRQLVFTLKQSHIFVVITLRVC